MNLYQLDMYGGKSPNL